VGKTDKQAAFTTIQGAILHVICNRVLGTVLRHDVPDLLEAGPLDAAELARRADLHELSLTRGLRLLASFGLFRELEPGRFAHSDASLFLLGRPGGFHNWALYATSELYWRSFGAVGHALRTGESAFEHAYGTTFWDYLHHSPDEHEVFNALFAELRGTEQDAIAAAYDWTDAHVLVDVGGGNGSLLAAILARDERLRGIVFDRPAVLAGADEHLSARGVRDRCELVAGDFFESIPAEGDTWLLSQILHDWDDARCRTILARCRERMRSGDRLLVLEMVTVPGAPERPVAIGDVSMLALFGEARQRSADEYRELFDATGLELVAERPTDSAFSVVEARPRPG
jgi:hypothetical protein